MTVDDTRAEWEFRMEQVRQRREEAVRFRVRGMTMVLRRLEGATYRELAEEFGVSQTRANEVVRQHRRTVSLALLSIAGKQPPPRWRW